jgi:hypothetical protein
MVKEHLRGFVEGVNGSLIVNDDGRHHQVVEHLTLLRSVDQR